MKFIPLHKLVNYNMNSGGKIPQNPVWILKNKCTINSIIKQSANSVGTVGSHFQIKLID